MSTLPPIFPRMPKKMLCRNLCVMQQKVPEPIPVIRVRVSNNQCVSPVTPKPSPVSPTPQRHILETPKAGKASGKAEGKHTYTSYYSSNSAAASPDASETTT